MNFPTLEETRTLVDSIPEAELREFVAQAAHNHLPYLNGLHAAFAPELTPEHWERFYFETDTAAYKYEHKGYITYEHVSDYAQELEEILQRQARPLIRRRRYGEAFEIIWHIFHLINSNSAHWEGEETTLGEYCIELWRDILAHCTPAEKEEMLHSLRQDCDEGKYVYLEDMVRPLIDDLEPSRT